MDSWFTVETIDCQTCVISEYRHWEEMGSDYIRGRLGITDGELEAFRKTILE